MDTLSQIDYRPLLENCDNPLGEKTRTSSKSGGILQCNVCNIQNSDSEKFECSKCAQIACSHKSLQVRLTTLGETVPRRVCNDCFSYFAQKCAKIKQERKSL